jgi:hypothetical protein
MRMPTLDRNAESRPLTQNVLLPHQLIETARPHPHRQGSIGSNRTGLARFYLGAFKQPVSHYVLSMTR